MKKEKVKKRLKKKWKVFTVILDMPISQEVLHAFDLIKESKYECKLLSDSNTIYIDYFLNKHNIKNCFTEIYTNTAKYENGLLKITPYTVFNNHFLIQNSHNCKDCPKNICKGEILDKMDISNRKIIYIGDSSNDICPCKRLREYLT